MTHRLSTFLIGAAILGSAVWLAPLGSAPLPPAPQGKAAAQKEITAALPVIPDAKFSLADFGAVGDGKTLNTEAFKKAVAAVDKAGGGHLTVPAGTYKTLPFSLVSHMDLHLDAGAVIKAPDTFEEYGIPDPNKAPTTPPGGGRGAFGRIAPLISCPPGTTPISPMTGSSAQSTDRAPSSGCGPIKPRADILRGARSSRGRFWSIGRDVERLHVDGITLTNSPMFHLVPTGKDITIENLRIVAPSDAPNTDAIDPGGQRIVIRKCEIDTGDDNVALHSGSQDVLVEDLTCLHGHGISIGSPTRDGLSHVIVRRCTFDGTDNGLRIKSYRGNGGEVHDIWYSDITMKNVRRPFDINMLVQRQCRSGHRRGAARGHGRADAEHPQLPRYSRYQLDRDAFASGRPGPRSSRADGPRDRVYQRENPKRPRLSGTRRSGHYLH